MKIIHVLSDGTVVDSIEGMTVPAGHPAYAVIAKARKMQKEKAKADKDSVRRTYSGKTFEQQVV